MRLIRGGSRVPALRGEANDAVFQDRGRRVSDQIIAKLSIPSIFDSYSLNMC
jgi:hypothetical protein